MSPGGRAFAIAAIVALAVLAGCGEPSSPARETDGDTGSSPGPSPFPTFHAEALPIAEGLCVVVGYEAGPLGGPAEIEGTTAFQVGKGHTGWGLEVERGIMGHMGGDVVTVWSNDTSGRASGSVTLPTVFGPHPLEQSVTREEFHVANPNVDVETMRPGDRVEHHPWDQNRIPGYNATWVGRNATHVTVLLHPDHGRLTPLLHYPIAVRTEVPGDGTWLERFETRRHAAFSIPPAPMSSCWPDFGLAPGNYTVVEVREASLMLHREPALSQAMQGPAWFRLEIQDYVGH